MSAERLLEPLGSYFGVDLGADHERPIAPTEPVLEGHEIFAAADRDALGTGRARERGEVGVGEAREIYRAPHRAEVVYLRAVGRVVVDHDEHRQTVAGSRLQLPQSHKRAAIAYSRYGEPIGPGDSRADSAAEPEADRLERIREDKAPLVGDLEVHR